LKIDASAFDFCRWCPEIRRHLPHPKDQGKARVITQAFFKRN
jgi:hypothetical protein